MDDVIRVQVGKKEYNVDISKEFDIDENDILGEMSKQASKLAFWGTLWAIARRDLMRLEDIAYARYEAHIKEVAKYYLVGSGIKKPTLEAIQNTAIKLWSKKHLGDEDFQTTVVNMVAEAPYENETAPTRYKGLTDWVYQKEFIIPWEEWQNRLIDGKHVVETLGIVMEAMRHKMNMLQSIGAMMRSEQNMAG